MGFLAQWGFFRNPMGFACGFLRGIFTKLKFHGVETFKLNIFKNKYLEIFYYFYNTYIYNKTNSPFCSNLWLIVWMKRGAQRRKNVHSGIVRSSVKNNEHVTFGFIFCFCLTSQTTHMWVKRQGPNLFQHYTISIRQLARFLFHYRLVFVIVVYLLRAQHRRSNLRGSHRLVLRIFRRTRYG